jgi:phosphatidylinositol N-acetylglucosaminyltransferase subunit P
MIALSITKGVDNIAVYAFVGKISSTLLFFIYVVWALSSDAFLHRLGISYYPDRYYALILPAYLLVTIVFVVSVYVGYNMMNTNDITSRFTISDEYSRDISPIFHQCNNIDGIPDFGDIDPVYISAALFDESDVHE